ncbi:MAG: MFS transporter [Haloarculaceae archaeon]
MSRRRLFGSLLGLVFLVNLARIVFAPLLEPLAADFGVTAAALGPVATAAWLGSALPRLPTGYLLTKVPRHYVVVGSGAVLTVAALATASAPSVPALAGGALLMGLASGTYFIAANPLVSELFPDRVGSALGVHGMASQLAAVGAPLAVTAVLALGDWRTAFHAIAVLAALVTVATALATRGATMPDAGTGDRDLLAAVRSQWRLIATGVAVIGAVSFVWNGLFNFYVSYLLVKGVTAATARTLLTVVFGAGVPAFLVTGRLADRFPLVPLMLAIVAGFVVCLVALTSVSGLAALLAVSLVLGYVVHGLFPAMDAYLLGALPDHHRASAYAAYSASMMVVQATGSSAVGALVARGVVYDDVFRAFALGLVGVLAVLVVLWRTGRLPDG